MLKRREPMKILNLLKRLKNLDLIWDQEWLSLPNKSIHQKPDHRLHNLPINSSQRNLSILLTWKRDIILNSMIQSASLYNWEWTKARFNQLSKTIEQIQFKRQQFSSWSSLDRRLSIKNEMGIIIYKGDILIQYFQHENNLKYLGQKQ